MPIHCMLPPPAPGHGFAPFHPGFEEHPFFGPHQDDESEPRGFGGPRGGHHHHRGGGPRGRGGFFRGRNDGLEPHEMANPFERGPGCMPRGPRHDHHGFRDGHHHRFPPHHRGGRGGRGGIGLPFDLPSFLENFAAELDPGHGAAWHGHRRRGAPDSQVDFVPRADVFSTPSEYVVHVSLPGAQKSDVSVDYDSDNSTLRLSGVIHRPEFSEELHEAMILDERHHEVGVFERSIQLGTRAARANVDHEKLSAKFTDGVLVVRLPKSVVDSEQFKKKVTIEEDSVDADNHNTDETEKDIEAHEANEKHASVVEVPDETDTMNVDTETEPGDLLTEVEDGSYTSSHDSEEENLYDTVKSKEFTKINVE